jgi:hypothetical protein
MTGFQALVAEIAAEESAVAISDDGSVEDYDKRAAQ